ncbi:hypothetical protein JAAARDRAFT_59315 [Jaapia argillacea MUCL 33604]|uniref:Major facilitator superfamily (MFS) profile domain-containing protein n=1 Tax=Jaapia argillacea MUCL 33604 TaxID=933084 RepID=A0A067Q1K1_9AGAM|nr:hypothetical protein JAAARDRAFT_59315 [Jaapia argillacea MUCL 33604]
MRPYIVAVGLFAALGSFLFGYDTGIITTSIAHPSFKEYMGNPNNAATGAIVATYIAGEAVGAFIQIFLGDRLGRIHFMQLMCVVVTIGTIIQTAAQNYAMFLVGRITTGIAVGALVATVPIYNSEVSPPSSRGLIGGLSGIMISTGTAISNIVGFAFGYADPNTTFQWRMPLALQVPLGMILFLGLQFFLPNSPRWLIRHGRDQEALYNFTKIRGDLVGPDLREEFDLMKKQILFEKDREITSYAEIWRTYRKRALICVSVQAMTSCTGVNVIQYYQTTLYNGLGITGQSILLLSAIYGICGAVANALTTLFVVDRFGRRNLMLVGTSSICLSLTFSAVMSRFFLSSDNSIGKGFAIFGLYWFTVSYYGCLNSSTWLYGAEVVPVSLRSKLMGTAACAHFIVNIGLTEAGPSAFANIKENYYYVFVVCSFFSTLMIWRWYPETKGLTLEAIAGLFNDKVAIPELAGSDKLKEKGESVSEKNDVEEVENV